MTHQAPHSMNELYQWARWWTSPWSHSQQDWWPFDLDSPAAKTLCRSRHERIGVALGITPCLPIHPSPALLHLVLAPTAQRELMLALVEGIYHPQHDSALSTDQREWCARMSMALPPASHKPSVDPLYYLRSWVDPAIWQRLRLSFSRQRVQQLESALQMPAASKLDTVWQAVIWRASALANNVTLPAENLNHALPTQD